MDLCITIIRIGTQVYRQSTIRRVIAFYIGFFIQAERHDAKQTAGKVYSPVTNIFIMVFPLSTLKSTHNYCTTFEFYLTRTIVNALENS